MQTSTTRFPFTKHGFREFNRYIKRQLFDAMELWFDTMERQADMIVRLCNSLKLKADVLKCQADALGPRADELKRLADALKQRVDAFGRRAVALKQLVDACNATMDFFNKRYKEHMRRTHTQNTKLSLD